MLPIVANAASNIRSVVIHGSVHQLQHGRVVHIIKEDAAAELVGHVASDPGVVAQDDMAITQLGAQHMDTAADVGSVALDKGVVQRKVSGAVGNDGTALGLTILRNGIVASQLAIGNGELPEHPGRCRRQCPSHPQCCW